MIVKPKTPYLDRAPPPPEISGEYHPINMPCHVDANPKKRREEKEEGSKDLRYHMLTWV